MRSHLPALVTAAVVAVLTVLGSAGVSAAQSGSVLLSVELPHGPGAGAKVFAQKGCIRCHSVAAAGGRIGPDLGRVVFFGSVLDLAGAFWNHAPLMREKMAALKIQRPSVTTEEMADLVAFLTAFRYYETEIREPGNPALGRNVFVKKGCAGCHEGTPGQTTPGPDLQRYRGRYAPIFLAQAMWNHSSAMAAAMQARGVAWPTFTGREMTDLVGYLQAGLATGSPEPTLFDPGSPRRGRVLFASKRCNACHAVAGEGGHVGPDLSAAGRARVRSTPEIAGLMWNHSQPMHAEFARRGIPVVTFSGQEMADIIAYLYFVNYASVRAVPSRGGQIFVQKCSTCHAFGRKGIGPDLAAAPGLDQPIGIIAAMWNHAAGMEQQFRERRLTWPRLEPGDTADLAAFLISRRPASASSVTPKVP